MGTKSSAPLASQAPPLLSVLSFPQKPPKQERICTPTGVAALVTMAQRQKQPKCPLRGERISKMSSIQKMEYWSASKRKKILTRVTTRRNLEHMILSEVRQVATRQILHEPTSMKYLEQSNSERQKMERWLPVGRGEYAELMLSGDGVSVQGEEKNCGDGRWFGMRSSVHVQERPEGPRHPRMATSSPQMTTLARSGSFPDTLTL